MERKPRQWGKLKGGGTFLKNGNWNEYWTTKITQVDDKHLHMRGYYLPDIMKNLTYAQALYLMIMGELPTKREGKVMDALLLAIMDYDFVSPTSTVGRMVASANPESPIPGIAAGILAIGKFTVSPQDSSNLIENAYKMMKEQNMSKGDVAKKVVQQYIDSKERIPGFGHPLYHEVDPRAAALQKIAKENDCWGEKGEIYEAIHDEYEKATKRKIAINIDGMMACVATEMGFDPLEIAGLAAVSFMCGIIPHVMEEIKEGSPIRMVPPMLVNFQGVPPRELPKLRE